MKKLALLLIILPLLCCEKEAAADPRDASRIEGRWKALFPSHPEYMYVFDSGLLHQSHTAFGAVISERTYTYATRQDTLLIGGDAINPPRDLLLYFHCDSILEARNVTPGAVLASAIWLKRTL